MRKIFYFLFFILWGIPVSSCIGNEVDTIPLKKGGSLQIEFIKHGSLLLTYEGKRIYVDPATVFADYSRYSAADVILFTHDHDDHFDMMAVNHLRRGQTEIIGNASVIGILNRGRSMKNGDTAIVLDGKVLVEAVPAYNTTPERMMFHPEGRDNGYVLTIEGTRIYIAGDTEVIPAMSRLGRVDVAFLPVNQPYTMTLSQAVTAASMVSPRIFYPYHYGETEVKNLIELLPGMDVRIRQMQ